MKVREGVMKNRSKRKGGWTHVTGGQAGGYLGRCGKGHEEAGGCRRVGERDE